MMESENFSIYFIWSNPYLDVKVYQPSCGLDLATTYNTDSHRNIGNKFTWWMPLWRKQTNFVVKADLQTLHHVCDVEGGTEMWKVHC